MIKGLMVVLASLSGFAAMLALYFLSNIWLGAFHMAFLPSIDVAQGACVFIFTAILFGMPALMIWDTRIKNKKP